MTNIFFGTAPNSANEVIPLKFANKTCCKFICCLFIFLEFLSNKTSLTVFLPRYVALCPRNEVPTTIIIVFAEVDVTLVSGNYKMPVAQPRILFGRGQTLTLS